MTGCPLLDSEFVARKNGKRLPCERLAEENAKLRELVQDMQHAIGCLVVLGDAYAERHEDELCALDDRMNELGVDA